MVLKKKFEGFFWYFHNKMIHGKVKRKNVSEVRKNVNLSSNVAKKKLREKMKIEDKYHQYSQAEFRKLQENGIIRSRILF